jgi:hypothetical protein
MEDFDTAYTPVTLKMKHIVQVLLIFILVLVLTTLFIGITYIVSCYLDKETPIEVLNVTADDTVTTKAGPGHGKFHYHFDGYRKRACEVEVYKYAVDVKGQIVYSSLDTRPSNGSLKRYIVDDNYQLNGNETPGTATFHIMFKWQCPNNIVQTWNPLIKDFSDNFEIYASEEDKKEGRKSTYTPPPIQKEDNK